MSKVAKKVGKVVGKVTGGIFGGPALPEAAMPGVGANPWDEYKKGRSQLEEQRAKDLSGMKARLGASGLAQGSAGWENALSQLTSSYDEKLKEFGNQEYFKSIQGQSGFGMWSDQEPEQGAGGVAGKLPGNMGSALAKMLGARGLKLPGMSGGDGDMGGSMNWWAS